MKLRWGFAHFQHPDRRRQNVVQRLGEISRGDGRLRDKCHHLGEGVHSGVGASRALRQDLFAGDASNG